MNKKIINYLAKNCKKDFLKILVIGPGKSNIVKTILSIKSVSFIDMVDHNEEAFLFQKELLKEQHCSVNYYTAELSIKEPLSFLDKTYDLILCTEVIEHVNDNFNLLKKINQLITADGIFIISVPNKFVDNALLKVNKAYMQTDDHTKGHVNFYNKSEFKALLKNSGFKLLWFKGISSEYVFFHFILVYFNVHIDEDTGQIYDMNHPAFKWGARVMRGITLIKLNYIFDFLIPRNFLAIVNKID
jgi:2-polyprenyl-3-methyl-5-hydroxy-6-metoxy-1,4-benzoquinol methylase